MILEPHAGRPAGLRDLRRDLTLTQMVNGLVAFIFAATGPLAVVLSVGSRAGLSEEQIASWIFGAFFLNALVSVPFILLYRQPLVFFWSTPGTVLLGPALEHLSLAEVMGASMASGLLMLLLGSSGWVKRAMAAVPMPIVMGMVAGVFLPFGLDLVRAFDIGPWIALPMALAFLGVSAVPTLTRRLPPLIAALLAGTAAALLTGWQPVVDTTQLWAAPIWQAPALSWTAMVELVVPLTIAVLVVQNGQGMAVLMSAGHRPPMNAIAAACGGASLVTGLVGTVTTCLTGPVSAILAAGGDRQRQYAGAVIVALLAMAFGMLSPLFTRLLLTAPKALVATLAGLAMLKVLEGAFTGAFRGRFALGALVSFVVTLTGLPILNIGAPFWGLVFGWMTSRLLEREHFALAQGDHAA